MIFIKENLISFLIWCVSAYLVGSIPFGYILASLKGINIRQVGSGNIGATNVTRNLGKTFGAITLLLDAIKGFLPVFLAHRFIGFPGVLFVGASAILGHCYSIFFLFKGGKGVATTIGVLFAVKPILAGVFILFWVAGFITARISSISALTASSMLPVYTLVSGMNNSYTIFLGFLCIFIFYTHRENLRRIAKGEEGKMKEVFSDELQM